MTAARRFGILGGTFDPIHLGHVAVAEAARDHLALDVVWIVPTLVPPHRASGPAASAYHRYAMAALACADRPGLEASDIELDRPGPSYTADTLRRLHDAGRAAWQLFFITGADAFAEIATWRDYPEVVSLANFVVVSRPGLPATALPERLPALAARMRRADRSRATVVDDLETHIHLLACATPDVSSTHVRAHIRSGRPITGLVPSSVSDYIQRHGLYQVPGNPVRSTDNGE